MCAVDVCGFQQLFQSETKRYCFRQDVQAADMVVGTLLQSEANGKRVWSFLLEAGFGKLASKVVLPQWAEVVMKHLGKLASKFLQQTWFWTFFKA